MSELERVWRLPVFIDEEQWARAFAAAQLEVELLVDQGYLWVPGGTGPVSKRGVATRIARAALRAASQADGEGDISDVLGVHVDEVSNRTDGSLPAAAAAAATASVGTQDVIPLEKRE